MNELKLFAELAGNDWKTLLNEIIKKDGESENSQLTSAFYDLLSAIRIQLVENKEQKLQSLKKEIDNELLYKDLLAYVESYSQAMRFVTPLRKIGQHSPEQAQLLLSDIMKNCTVRNNPFFYSHYKDYGLKSEEELSKISSVITTFAEFLVSNAMSLEAMKEGANRNLNLGDELEEYLAALVEENYREIQLKLIMEKLEILK